jgi:hypothetical protein
MPELTRRYESRNLSIRQEGAQIRSWVPTGPLGSIVASVKDYPTHELASAKFAELVLDALTPLSGRIQQLFDVEDLCSQYAAAGSDGCTNVMYQSGVWEAE